MEAVDFPICILKMNLQCCQDLPLRIKKLLRKVKGVYAITIDPAKDLIVVSGTAEPPVLIKAIERIGQTPQLYAYEKDPAKAKTQFRTLLKRYSPDKSRDEPPSSAVDVANSGTCPVGGEAVRGGFGHPRMMQMPMFTLPPTNGPPGWLAPGPRPRLMVKYEEPKVTVRKAAAPYPFDFYEKIEFPGANSLFNSFSDDNSQPLTKPGRTIHLRFFFFLIDSSESKLLPSYLFGKIMSRRWILVMKPLRRVYRGDVETLFSSALCNRTIYSVSEPEQYESSSNHVVLDESYVLAELSSLLPISSKTSVAKKDNSSRNQAAAIDSFLLPEDKLRGVFLQKLKGKSAIEKSLTSLGINLSIEIVANVLDQGNLSGEAMVAFFSWAIHEPGVSKDVDSYCVILRALGRRKFFSFMTDVLRGMPCEGVNPNLKCLTIAMDSFARAHYVRRAIELFEESRDFGVKCNTESFNSLLQCLCERSHVTAASSVFNAKKGKIPFDTYTYNTMLNGWSKLGEIDEMEKVLKEMVEGGFDPNCLSFSHLIEGLGRAGRVNDSVEIFDNVKHKGIVPDASVYNAMICNFIFARDFDGSIRYYRKMLDEECEPDLDTYSELLSGLIKGRKVSDALEIFEEMFSRGMVPTTGLVTSFLKPLCSYGPPHAAMVIYQKARKAKCKISQSAYKMLLKRLSRFGKCGMLLNVWDEMQECGYPSDVEVYEYIVDGLCNIGHLENAVLVMEEAMRKGFCPDRLVYSRLNNKLMASNKTEMAYKLFLKIKEARVKENARKYWRRNGWHF